MPDGMTFEEFEKAKAEQLRAEAKRCFDGARTTTSMGFKAPYLLEAQFYMQELDRQHGDKIARRDYRMEVWVIRLIALELILALAGIGLSIKEGYDESRMMDKQDAILTNLQKSSADTSKALANLTSLTTAMTNNTSASASKLLSLRSTTQEMNKGVQSQVSLFYDPSMSLLYDPTQNRIMFQNTGRSAITIDALYLDGEKLDYGENKLVTSGTVFYLEFSKRYEPIANGMSDGQVKTVNVKAILANEVNKNYVLDSALLFVKENGKVTVHPQNASIRPEP